MTTYSDSRSRCSTIAARAKAAGRRTGRPRQGCAPQRGDYSGRTDSDSDPDSNRSCTVRWLQGCRVCRASTPLPSEARAVSAVALSRRYRRPAQQHAARPGDRESQGVSVNTSTPPRKKNSNKHRGVRQPAAQQPSRTTRPSRRPRGARRRRRRGRVHAWLRFGATERETPARPALTFDATACPRNNA